MRKSILHLFTLCVFSLTMFEPVVSLNAAELWNSKKYGGGQSKGYYNKGNNANKGDYTLYNKKDSDYNNDSLNSVGGLDSSVQAYKKLKIAREVNQSKLWDLMDKSAIAGRQADVNLSLQREYDNRVRLRALLLKSAKERKAYYIAGKKRHRAKMSAVESINMAKRVKAWEKKNRKLQPNANDGDYSFNNEGGKYKKRIKVKKREKILGAPTKLYNSSKY